MGVCAIVRAMSRPSRRSSAAAPATTDRAIADLVREGVIDSVDLDAGKAVVRMGDILTPPVDWLMSVGDTTLWLAPTVGQPVAVICPEGDIERAFIAGGLPSSQMAPLFLGAQVAIRFKDGALIIYDPEAKALQLQLTGSAEIIAPDGVSIAADVAIEGDLSVTGDLSVEGAADAKGKITSQDDVVGGGKSLKGHRHLGVQTGSGVTGAPQ